ncbi:hypothetical protein ACRAWF_38640 [Streptomyces sp. L7]
MNRTQALNRWFTADNNPVQVFGTVAAVVIAALTVRPTGFSGTGLAVLCLLVLESLLLCTRLIPEGTFSPRVQLVVLCTWAVGGCGADEPGDLRGVGAVRLLRHWARRVPSRSPPRAALRGAHQCPVRAVRCCCPGAAAPRGSWARSPVSVCWWVSPTGPNTDALRSARAAAEQAEVAARAVARAGRRWPSGPGSPRDVHDVPARSPSLAGGEHATGGHRRPVGVRGHRPGPGAGGPAGGRAWSARG